MCPLSCYEFPWWVYSEKIEEALRFRPAHAATRMREDVFRLPVGDRVSSNPDESSSTSERTETWSGALLLVPQNLKRCVETAPKFGVRPRFGGRYRLPPLFPISFGIPPPNLEEVSTCIIFQVHSGKFFDFDYNYRCQLFLWEAFKLEARVLDFNTECWSLSSLLYPSVNPLNKRMVS